MSKYHSLGNVADFVTDSLQKTENFLLIISPFIKETALRELFSKLKHRPKKFLVVVRWLPQDLLSGVSDIGVYDFVKKLGGEMYVNDQIHAKVYLSDYRKALVGSANLTNKGIGYIEDHNVEALVQISCDESFLRDVQSIIDSSAKLNDDLLSEYKKLVESYKDCYKQRLPDGVNQAYSTIKIMLKKVQRGGLFVHDFPLSKVPVEIKDESRQKFLQSTAYLWQKKSIVEPTSFGAYCAMLHDSLLDEPSPYRKDVKDLTSSMFKWTKIFSDEFTFYTPNHTEIISPK